MEVSYFPMKLMDWKTDFMDFGFQRMETLMGKMEFSMTLLIGKWMYIEKKPSGPRARIFGAVVQVLRS